MDWLKKLWNGLRGGGPEVPDWARFFSPADYALFLRAVERDLTGRGLACAIDDGIATVTGLPHGRPSQLGLQNLAQACAQSAREDWGPVVRRHFDVVMKGAPDLAEISKDFEKSKSLLKVRLYPESTMGGRDHVVCRPLAPGLVETLVYDLPETIATVHPDHLKEWPAVVPELFALGLANVRAMGVPERAGIEVQGGVTLTLLSSESFFAASHALLLGDVIELTERGALVGVPHRHAVLLHPISDMDVCLAVNAMIPALLHLHEQGPGSITPDLYWVRPTGWTHLPARITKDAIEFRPPDEFVKLLDRLAEPPKPSA